MDVWGKFHISYLSCVASTSTCHHWSAPPEEVAMPGRSCRAAAGLRQTNTLQPAEFMWQLPSAVCPNSAGPAKRHPSSPAAHLHQPQAHHPQLDPLANLRKPSQRHGCTVNDHRESSAKRREGLQHLQIWWFRVQRHGVAPGIRSDQLAVLPYGWGQLQAA